MAASQARLLLLTARQDDVESQLMSVANQKLSLSRKTAELSAEYRKALNATSLTWSTDQGNIALTYDLLMRPNTVADAGQYILTNASTGKVILDSNYIGELGLAQAGNPGDIANMSYISGGVTYTGEKAFVMKLVGCNSDNADYYIQQSNSTKGTSIFETNYSDTDIIANSIGLGAYPGITTLGQDSDSSSWWGGSSSSVDPMLVLHNFDLLLKDNYAAAIGSSLNDYLVSYLGADYSDEIKKALDYAYQATFNKFVYNVNDTDSKDGAQLGTSISFANGDADNTNRIASKTVKDSGFLGFSSSSETTVTVDNSQLADTFMSYFDQYCAQNYGGVNSSTIGPSTTTRGSQGGTGQQTDKMSYHSELQAGDSDINRNKVNDAYEASFYINLYNALYSYGWQAKENADDKKYLQNEILYGNIAIKQRATDGTWQNLSTNDSGSPLRSERDQEAISKAEADYSAAKDTLSTKEVGLDLVTQNLDSERTAITTEMESVKSMLKKNIESSFKMFDA
ncbi:MAG: hypothetical protein WCG95_07190 [bacterium]